VRRPQCGRCDWAGRGLAKTCCQPLETEPRSALREVASIPALLPQPVTALSVASGAGLAIRPALLRRSRRLCGDLKPLASSDPAGGGAVAWLAARHGVHEPVASLHRPDLGR